MNNNDLKLIPGNLYVAIDRFGYYVNRPKGCICLYLGIYKDQRHDRIVHGMLVVETMYVSEFVTDSYTAHNLNLSFKEIP
jgi:hypothetical protein